jgi:formylglycine-generating enzyme required for sulfatase activity
MSKFSWLHLTDLHQGMWSQDWLWPNVREEFFADLGRLHETCGPWDVVLFTGDLTQKGTAEEFEKLDQTLAQLWERLAVLGSKPVLLAVPGNHDLARPDPKKLKPVHKLLAGWVNNAEAHEDLWTDETSESRVAITEMFAAYQAWWAKHELKLPHDWQLRRGLLPGDWSLTIPHGDRRIGVVGLNSSYVQLREGNFENKLHLDTRQFHAASGGDGPRWAEQHDVSLLLTHHGPGWFGPDGYRHLREEIDVPGRFVAHLHGHMHEQQQYVSAEAGSRPRRRWQGPSLFGLEWFEGKVERVHGYTAGRIDFDASDSSVAQLRLWPRNAVKTGSGKRTLGVDRSIEVDGDGGTRAEPIELRRIDPILARRRQLERDFRDDGDVTKFEAGDAQLLAQVQDPPARASKVLGGRYQLWHSLGSGGFAEIWGAFDRSTRRPVVIKILHRHWSSDRSRAERFEQGAREMRQLSHPALVPILEDVARDEAGRLYYPMRWLLGGDLHARISAGSIERSAALEALARALEGLEHAHEHGLVHRDIKPSNILLDDDDRGWLSDFDLLRGGSESAVHTRVGQGTRAQVYVAPEVIDDEVSDHRADVYGAGMCALFVLGGKNPPSHVGTLKPEYIDALDCSEPLRAAVRRAVAILPAKRSRSCRQLIDALRGYASPIVAEPSRIAVVGTTPSAVPPRPTWIHETGTDEFGEWASFRVGAVVQRMRKLAAGSFLMGSPADEPGRESDEGPQHMVMLTQGFWVADSPCTQALWQAVMGGNPSEFRSPERPVEKVSWEDVQLFLEQLEVSVPGLGAVLPTEAQWEYACRAGTTTVTYAGPMQILGQYNAPVLDEIAWYGGNSGLDWDLVHGHDSTGWAEKQYPHTVAGTRIVKLKRPNAWGLYDMLGNLWEWCADGERTYASSPEQDPVGPPGPARVKRGGGYWHRPCYVRAACRDTLEPDDRDRGIGFRLARGQGLR